MQGVVVRTNSRDTIYQAKISLARDEPAPSFGGPIRRQLVEPSNMFTGGRLARAEEAEGLIRP